MFQCVVLFQGYGVDIIIAKVYIRTCGGVSYTPHPIISVSQPYFVLLTSRGRDSSFSLSLITGKCNLRWPLCTQIQEHCIGAMHDTSIWFVSGWYHVLLHVYPRMSCEGRHEVDLS